MTDNLVVALPPIPTNFVWPFFLESTTVEGFLYIRYFTQGVDAKVEIKWSDPIGAHTEINPKGFTQLK